jgi:hypothetical protein
MNVKKIALLLAAGLTLAGAATAGSASAETTWQHNHPRRVEVNGRLATQNFRIHQARSEGRIGAGKAYRLHLADQRIRLQERQYASLHGGHLTRGEQGRINHEENRVSHRIG